MSSNGRVIIIDDEIDICRALEQTLTLHDYEVQYFTSAEKALELIHEDWEGVIVSDINMPNMDGREFLKVCKGIDPEIPFIVLTGHGDVSLAVECMREGAYDFLEKPLSVDTFIESVKRSFEHRKLILENRQLRDDLDAQSGPGPRILGNNEKIKALRATLSRIKDVDTSVLIQGETGVGKELAARFLHDHGSNSDGAFVVINCGAISDEDIDQELFGGVVSESEFLLKGKIAAAHKGTLFLDGIENMSDLMQQKLNRFLADNASKLSAGLKSAVQLRVISASTENIAEFIDEGQFQAELYYHLSVIQFSVPPLRDRESDIPLLFENYLRIASSRYQISPPKLSLNQQVWLQTHNWTGNLRELRNVAERYILTGDKGVFSQADDNNELTLNLSMGEQVSRFEKTLIHDALTRSGGRLKAVQVQLCIPRKTLYEKMVRYGLDKSQYKE